MGSTGLAQRLGEDGAQAFRRTHFGLLRSAFAPYGGREVKNLGDGLMVVFDEDGEVTDAVAAALRVERRAGVALAERVVEFLTPKRALLVLDNCEQVVDGAADLASTVLAGTRSVDVLATSREALGLPGEHRMQLEPLGLERGTDGTPAPAVALFLERTAAMGRPVADTALPSVVALCRRVDGLPLAIELAASQAASRTIPQTVTDVTDRLADLSVRRGRAGRHRSIHALVDSSYELLDEAQRRLFERMAVFAGGAEAEAVAAVTGLHRARTVDLLADLVDRSMVATRPQGGRTRYSLLEPVRAYAGQRLSHTEHASTRDGHAAYFVDLAQQVDAAVRSGDDKDWASRLHDETPNLRAAHSWLIQRGSVEAGLRLAGAMFWCGWNGMVSEVLVWAEQVVETFADSRHPLLPAAFATAGCGAWLRGDLVRAAELARRGFDAETESSKPCPELRQIAGNIAIQSGEFDRAAKLYDETAAARASGNHFAMICGLGSTGMAHG